MMHVQSWQLQSSGGMGGQGSTGLCAPPLKNPGSENTEVQIFPAPAGEQIEDF